MKKLPIGKSTLQTMIEENYVYIDKTYFAYDLIENGGGYYFLSRPRRFGKSLFLDTLRTIFDGKKELFKGLYIYDKYDWSKTYPVIYISFGGGDFSSREQVRDKIKFILDYNKKNLNIRCTEYHESSLYFQDLIIQGACTSLGY